MHRILGRFGLEVRLLRNLRRAQRLEREARDREQWRFLANVGIATILDVGANEGQFARIMRGVCPAARIYSFEPLPDVYALLTAAFAADPAVVPVNLALSDHAGTTRMHRSEFSPSSSLLTMGETHRDEWPQSARHTEVPVQLARLDDWAAGAELTEPLLVKLDVQGHELAVIAGGESTIRRARFVVAEVSFVELYEGQPLFEDVHARLSGLGFRYCGNLEQHYSRKFEQFLFADALFERVREEAQ